MNIVKTKTFRSDVRNVNMTDNMIRITMDAKRIEWAKIKYILRENGIEMAFRGENND